MPSKRRLISTGSPFEADFGYSRAVVQGDWCFVSGITGYDYETMRLPEHAAEQAANIFETLGAVLAEAGFDMNDIVRVQYTATDRAVIPEIQPILHQYLGDIRPAATMVIAGLIEPEMKIEIEVTAYRG